MIGKRSAMNFVAHLGKAELVQADISSIPRVLKALEVQHLESTLLSSRWFQISTCAPLHLGPHDVFLSMVDMTYYYITQGEAEVQPGCDTSG